MPQGRGQGLETPPSGQRSGSGDASGQGSGSGDTPLRAEVRVWRLPPQPRPEKPPEGPGSGWRAHPLSQGRRFSEALCPELGGGVCTATSEPVRSQASHLPSKCLKGPAEQITETCPPKARGCESERQGERDQGGCTGPALGAHIPPASTQVKLISFHPLDLSLTIFLVSFFFFF